MPISLNHTIVPARDKRASAEFLAEILGVPVGEPFGPFVPVHIGSVSLDFAGVDFFFVILTFDSFLVSEVGSLLVRFADGSRVGGGVGGFRVVADRT